MISNTVWVFIVLVILALVLIPLIASTNKNKNSNMNSAMQNSHRMMPRQEGYTKCICSSDPNKRNCQDTAVVQNAYDDGIVTEYTNLPSKGWTLVNPGDVNWPLSEGCVWPDNSKGSKQWATWDFTDF